MKIFINNKKFKEEKYKDLTLPELLEEFKSKFDDEIIHSIQINEVEVNEKYLKESLIDKDEINKIEFFTKKTSSLINETLDEANEYLPKLRKGTEQTASLFRNSDNEAIKNYHLILNGLEWYIEALSQITSLINNKNYYQKGQKMINEINKTLSDLMVAYNKEDFVLVADILEYEIVDIIENLYEFNNKLIEIID